MKQFAFFVTLSFLLSCTSHNQKHEQAKEKDYKNKENTNLLNRLRSFEPTKYKGSVPSNFYTFHGQYDWWRFPLVYPYSISCIDVTDYGLIRNDEGKTDFENGGSVQSVSDYFNSFTFDRNYLVATTVKAPFLRDAASYNEKYFIFSFANGTTIHINGRENLNAKLRELNYTGDTSFMTIRQYSKQL